MPDRPLPPNDRDIRRPDPDPTVLTTAQSEKGLLALREIIEARLDGMDKLIVLVQMATAGRQADIDAGIANLQKLLEEKIRSISTQLAERDTRTEQTARDSKVAVDAAFSAAKEAVGEQNKSSALAIAKSEAATTKQIDQIGIIITTMTAGLNDKIDDIKTRLTAIEGRSAGIGTSWGVAVGGFGLLIAAVSVIVAVVLHAGAS